MKTEEERKPGIELTQKIINLLQDFEKEHGTHFDLMMPALLSAQVSTIMRYVKPEHVMNTVEGYTEALKKSVQVALIIFPGGDDESSDGEGDENDLASMTPQGRA